MFTGIVSQRAVVADVAPSPSGEAGVVRLVLELERAVAVAVGDSVAIDGVCLTAVEIDDRRVRFDVVPESMRRTTLGRRRAGDRVNVETSLRMGDPLGGHLVVGHVDGVGTIAAVERRGDDVRVEVALPDAMRGATVSKGSIAIDGVSLTVGESDERSFSVYLIPHTLAATGLGQKRAGDAVNLEADLVGRYVEHHVRRWLSGSLSKSEVPSESSS